MKNARGAMVFALGVIGLAGLVRCSLLVDTGGLSSGAGESDAASSDAFADGAVSDADVGASDASNDAASSGDARLFTCDASHTICDDFDTAALGTRWSSIHTDHGTADLVSDASVSPPQSLSLTLAQQGASAALIKELSVQASTIHCAIKVLVSGETLEVLHFEFAGENGASDHVASVRLGTKSFVVFSTTFVDGGNNYEEVDLPALVLGAWTPLTIDLMPGDAGPSIVVTLNEGKSGPSVVHASPAPSGGTLARITIGAQYVSAPSRALIDDVVCDVAP